jgi:hypothetical protein
MKDAQIHTLAKHSLSKEDYMERFKYDHMRPENERTHFLQWLEGTTDLKRTGSIARLSEFTQN